ncbi:MAG: DM13 domain-containing protein, partial [Thermoleophilia bacterium]|nr:DM13 domain-containing protein [Thermoleophilia bacterium]
AYLGYTSTTDRTVDEVLVSGPAALEGSFRGLAQPTEGTAAVVEQSGELVLTLSDFRTGPWPDLFVYVVPGSSSGDDVDGAARLGGPKVPTATSSTRSAGLDLPGGATVVVWCRAFSISFGAAWLAGAA